MVIEVIRICSMYVIYAIVCKYVDYGIMQRYLHLRQHMHPKVRK